jgi:hypothetical protein
VRCLVVLALVLSSATAFADGPTFYAFRILPNKTAKPILDADDKLAVGDTREYLFAYGGKAYVAVMVAKKRAPRDPGGPGPRYELDIYRDKIDRATYVTNVIFPYPDGPRRFECGVGSDSDFAPLVAVGMSLDGSARAACESTWKSFIADLPAR